MTRFTTRVRPRLAGVALTATIAASMVLVTVPAGAVGAVQRNACRPLTDAKARVHAAAVRREATLAGLVATLQVRTDPWTLNGAQAGVLQSASTGISALDTKIQSTCYASLSALRVDAVTLLTNYRVYWLRVPQTHGIEAADRLAEARVRLGNVAARLATHTAGNAKAQSDLAAMNGALAAADAKLGTPPTPAGPIAALPGLVPAADMSGDVATMEAARADLVAARASLVQARADGLEVIIDLGA